jgi:hypothetical protein
MLPVVKSRSFRCICGNVFRLAKYFKWIFASGDQLISLIIDQTEQVYAPSRGGEGLAWGIHGQGDTQPGRSAAAATDGASEGEVDLLKPI